MHGGRGAIKRSLRSSGLRPLDQIPKVSIEIGKDGDGAIGLVARRLAENDAGLKKALMVAGEIIGFEKKADTATGLVADGRALGLVLGLGEQERGPLASPGTDHQPALAVGHSGVFHAVEAEAVTVEGLGPVIAVDDEADEKEAVCAHEIALSVRCVTRRLSMSRIGKFPPRIEGFRE